MAEAQGFDLSLNFAESDDGASDRRILSNLIETGIEGDLILFANNLRNFSEIPAIAYSVSGNGTITITGTGYLPYSDGTKLIITTYQNTTDRDARVGASLGFDGAQKEFEVFESDALTTFRIKDSNGVPQTTGFAGALKGLRRKDIITFLNIRLLKETRIPAVDEALAGQSDEEGDISLFDNFNVAGVYAEVDSSIASLEFAKTGVPRTYEDSIFNSKNLVFEGNIRILNTQSKPITDDTVPGLYIQTGETAKRAFSDTSNPWVEGTENSFSAGGSGKTALITTADSAQIGKMIVSGTKPEFRGLWSTSFDTNDTGGITDWSHKIPIKINNGSTTLFMLVKT